MQPGILPHLPFLGDIRGFPRPCIHPQPAAYRFLLKGEANDMANDALIQTAAAPLWKEPKKGAERVDEALCGVSVEILESSGIYRRVRTCYRYEG